MKRTLIIFALLLSIVGGVFLVSRDSEQQDEPVKIGYLAIGAGLPLFVAEQKGYFEEEGLNVELIEFKSSNDIASAAVAGRIDLIGTGATNAMLDANSETGAKFRLFLVNNYVKRPAAGSTDFVIARAGSGVKSFVDLKGSTVAIFPGSVGEVFASAVVPKLGLQTDDLATVSMAPPQWLPALQSGSIDAVLGAVEPFATQIIEDGVGEVIVDGYYAELMQSVPASGAWFIEGALTNEQERGFVAAFGKALKDIRDDEKGARPALSAYTSISDDLVKKIRLQDWMLITEDGVSESALSFAQAFYDAGGIQELPQDNSWLWQE